MAKKSLWQRVRNQKIKDRKGVNSFLKSMNDTAEKRKPRSTFVEGHVGSKDMTIGMELKEKTHEPEDR